MADEYQRGTDAQWLEHSNHELKQLVKKRDRTIALLKLGMILLLVALGWVVFRFSQRANIQELWPTKAVSK
jgi:hypothetical protein